MARKRTDRPDLDKDEDEARPLLPATDDVARAIALLEWARDRGFRLLGPVKVGEVQFVVEDLRQTKSEGLNADLGPVDGGVYAEHGLKETDEPAPGTVG